MTFSFLFQRQAESAHFILQTFQKLIHMIAVCGGMTTGKRERKHLSVVGIFIYFSRFHRRKEIILIIMRVNGKMTEAYPRQTGNHIGIFRRRSKRFGSTLRDSLRTSADFQDISRKIHQNLHKTPSTSEKSLIILMKTRVQRCQGIIESKDPVLICRLELRLLVQTFCNKP